jgi:hypothetical protein
MQLIALTKRMRYASRNELRRRSDLHRRPGLCRLHRNTLDEAMSTVESFAGILLVLAIAYFAYKVL